jgi:hypothetical protein
MSGLFELNGNLQDLVFGMEMEISRGDMREKIVIVQQEGCRSK